MASQSVTEHPRKRVGSVTVNATSNDQKFRSPLSDDVVRYGTSKCRRVLFQPVPIGDRAEPQIPNPGAARSSPRPISHMIGIGKDHKTVLVRFTNCSRGAPVFGTPMSTARRFF